MELLQGDRLPRIHFTIFVILKTRIVYEMPALLGSWLSSVLVLVFFFGSFTDEPVDEMYSKIQLTLCPSSFGSAIAVKSLLFYGQARII